MLIIFALIYVTKFDFSGFRIERIFDMDELSTGNGRAEIWSRYLSIIQGRGLISVLFGVGPGNISRISNIGFYAHSTFLDFFFSYGVLGFAYIIFFEYKNLLLVARNNRIFLPLLVFIVLCYISHGSSSNTVLFILQGVIAGVSLYEKEQINDK